jgi:hypothetical protein
VDQSLVGISHLILWERNMDNRKQLTNDKKYLTIVHVVLYLIASHMNYYGNPSLFLTQLMSLLETKQQSLINLNKSHDKNTKHNKNGRNKQEQNTINFMWKN